MKLISCYIENFGCLCRRSFFFNEGFTLFQGDNGWGKTTLTVFLKSMFFGLGNSSKRKIAENERKKYKPWQGGKFGGSVTFLLENKKYRIERFFGAKDRDDTFILYDEDTGMVSNDFTEMIGEEIFKVDQSSFAMSMYFPQNQLPVVMTDRLNAKINDVDILGSDIDQYDSAISLLDERLKEYKKTGNRGKLSEWKEELAILNHQIEEGQLAEANRNIRLQQIDILNARMKDLNADFEKLKTQNDRIHKLLTERDATRGHREYLTKELERDEEKLHPLKDFFKGGIPEEDDIEQLIAIEETKKQFEFFPQEEVLKETGDRLNRETRALKAIEEEFGPHVPTAEAFEEIIAGIRKLNICEDKIQSKTQSFSEARKESKLEKKSRRSSWIRLVVELVIAGILFLICACATIFAENMPKVWIGGMVVFGVIIAVLIIVGSRLIGKEEAESRPEYLDAFQDEIENLHLASVKQKKYLSTQMKKYLKETSDDVRQDYSELSVLYSRYKMQTDREVSCERDYNTLLNEKKRFEEKKSRQLALGEEKKRMFSKKYGLNLSFWNLRMLMDLKQRRHDYTELMDRITSYKNELSEIAEDTPEVKSLPDADTIRDMLEKQDAIEARRQQLIAERESYRRDADLLGTRFEEAQSLITRKQELEEAYKEGEKNAALLEQTLSYLGRAHEKFSAHYVDKMRTNFDMYMRMIDPSAADRMHIDMNLHIREECHGSLYDGDYMSQGLYELAGICIRLALIDAMYEEEKPFLLLDDPFVNLDEKKTEKLLDVLHKLSDEYQIIYFTCHESRAV